LDQSLDFLSNFDLITPAAHFVQDFLNGPPADFGIPPHAGWASRDIRYLLSQGGVNVWGFIVYDDVLTFTVPKTQARWTYYLLNRQGVPILYAPPEAVDPPGRRRRRPGHSRVWWETLLGILDRLDKSLF
jgi:hypothetical protein